MKKKIFSIIAVLAFTASFVLPALIPQNAWADTTLEAYCSQFGGYMSSGTCITSGKTSTWCSEHNGSFTAPTSSNPKGTCKFTITTSSNSADESPTIDPDDDDSSSGGTSPTADSSGASSGSSAQESDPSKMDKACPEGEVYTSILGNAGGCTPVGEGGELIFSLLNTILTILTYGVGIAGTLGIVISGIQYLTARDNEAQLTKAKSRLVNIVIGLVAYALLWAFLQWLIPGGIF